MKIPVVNVVNPIKGVNAEYSENPVRLSLYVPHEKRDIDLGGGMKSRAWSRYSWVEESASFPGNDAPMPLRFKVFRTDEYLYLGFYMEDCGAGRVQSTDVSDGMGVWSGDMAEIHFGGLDPEAWHTQLCVGIAGNRFDSCAHYDQWEAKSFQDKNGWGAEVKISLSILQFTEGGFRFNLCRMSTGDKRKYATWSPVRGAFHHIADFGELLMCDYEQTMQLRFMQKAPGISRQEYQRRSAELRTPACAVTHGPYLTNPQQGKMTISWASAGRTAMGVEWKKAGSAEKPQRKFSFMQGGIATCNNFHSVDLDGLEPGAIYQYRLINVQQDWSLITSDWRKFKAAPKAACGEAFKFFTVTDIHSDVAHLRRCMATVYAREADLCFNLGDHLSLAMGQDALLNAVADPVSASACRKQDKPIIFLRGNHEFLGTFAGEYFKLMRFTNGRTWQTFTWGDVFFVVIDSGAENPDNPGRPHFSNTAMLEEETEFIRQTAASAEYRKAHWRIAMMHMPPIFPKAKKMPQIFDMAMKLVTKEARPDIMFCGHEHRYGRLEAGAVTLTENSDAVYRSRRPTVAPLPFPVLALGNTDAMQTAVEKDKLTFTVFDMRPSKPKVKDTFSIDVRK